MGTASARKIDCITLRGVRTPTRVLPPRHARHPVSPFLPILPALPTFRPFRCISTLPRAEERMYVDLRLFPARKETGMGRTRALAGLATMLLVGSFAPAWAAPTVAEILAYEPKQKGVVCSTATPDEQKLCTVEPVKNKKDATVGWLL